jgi:carbonic anhydrase
MNKAIIRLMGGFRRFREKNFLHNDLGDSFYQRLSTEGQSPKTLLIGCSDSRVDPAILTGASPGELFVIRNVANLVPPCEPAAVGFHGTSSAMEFAVVNLKVENIIVLGHRQCGGIRALMSGEAPDPESFIRQWMSIAEDARVKVLSEYPNADLETRCRMAEMESICVSLRNVHSFPFVRKAVEAGHLNVIGVYFDLERGHLWHYDEVSKKFVQLSV